MVRYFSVVFFKVVRRVGVITCGNDECWFGKKLFQLNRCLLGENGKKTQEFVAPIEQDNSSGSTIFTKLNYFIC